MHELPLITAIIDSACETAQREGAEEVRSIHLSVGVLRDFKSDLAQTCFAHFSRGTMAEGAALIIEVVPLRLRCSICHIVHEIEVPWTGTQVACPEHPDADSTIETGNELTIQSIVIR